MRPLSDNERRIVLLIKIHQKQQRSNPSWAWLQTKTGLSRAEFIYTMMRLRNIRAIMFRDGVQGSTWATRDGVQAALQKKAA